MLFGCLPARWAAAGGVIAAFHYGLAPQWIDSYWGGALTAFGGALLFGALCRLKHAPSPAMALLWLFIWRGTVDPSKFPNKHRTAEKLKFPNMGERRFWSLVASYALGQRQPPARAGEHDLGPFHLRQLGDGVRQRVVGQHPGHHDALASEKSGHGLPP